MRLEIKTEKDSTLKAIAINPVYNADFFTGYTDVELMFDDALVVLRIPQKAAETLCRMFRFQQMLNT